ncbi:hypothetical protein HGF60_06225 [Alteromonadaceae bacterium A_SAG2]|nr:hypothetical protein [Alteromonadaceae bacterium A_SAG2]|tara:strand:+ start:5115 stop:6797 length:1683 start_codon:yes stop_codon:yes gene_type:complete
MKTYLERKICLAWQAHDWEFLSNIDFETLERENVNNSCKLMVLISNLHSGKGIESLETTLQEITEARDTEGFSSLLFTSTYCSLAEAALALNDSEKAKFYMDRASEIIGLPDAPTWLDDIRITNLQKISEIYGSREAENICTLELGDAWAGNTVNTAIFRHHGMFTHSGKQYAAFYENKNSLKLVKRDINSNVVEEYCLQGNFHLEDAHNSISLGVDRCGIVHLSYDHHGSKLNYRRSKKPHSIAEWTDVLEMTGYKEDSVTYPAFILPSKTTPLLMLYRDGTWNKGAAYLKYYDEELEMWFDYDLPILSGAGQQPWTSNAYWNHPVVDKNGVIHLTFSWRIDYFSREQLICNLNIDYAKSYDGGLNWSTSKDYPYNLPITQVNSETVWAIAPGENHINQTSMALDSKGYPHVAFYMNDEFRVPQYFHLWFDGVKWYCSQVTKRSNSFLLSGAGTLKIPISRPEIVIDNTDTVYIIYRAEETQQKLVASYQYPPAYKHEPKQILTLWDEPVGYAEPVIDKVRWSEMQVLSLLVQYNEQPNGDTTQLDEEAPIRIVDIRIK